MTDKLIATDGTSSGLAAGAAISDTDYLELQQTVVSPASTVNSQFSAIKTWVKSWIAKADVGLGNVANSLQLVASNNLSDVASAATSRDNISAQAKKFKVYVSGRYYPPVGASSSGSMSLSANRVDLFPLLPDRDVSVSELDVRTGTGAAGNMQMAIYASDANGNPTGTPLANSSASQSTASSSTVLANAFASSLALTAGTLYWVACFTDTSSPSYGAMTAPFGAHSVLGSTSSNAILGAGMIAVTYTGATFPTWPTLTGQTFANNNTYPYWNFKVA